MKSKVLAEEPPEEIPLEQQYTFMDSSICYYPEFEDYQIYKGEVNPEKQKSKLITVFQLVGHGIAKAAPYVGNACKYAVSDIVLPAAKYVGIKAAHGVGQVFSEVAKDLKQI